MRFYVGQVVQHVQTKKEYVIVHGPEDIRIESGPAFAYAYRLVDDGVQYNNPAVRQVMRMLWVRPAEQMEDGRFVLTNKRQEV